ncbi:adenylyltransferase and sulfurtransferase MOCS3 [Thrips palmi]|uniref:Adenylyltransferase and sulfurtransferase MOCS3 homolog n=1 Tax=Thrips palmi TaxID=161013 RepID=A0A6P9A7J8_THRPL|nr:adenylyltransferase and sulfurtransferase MOCS3 [Thrips palmi]
MDKISNLEKQIAYLQEVLRCKEEELRALQANEQHASFCSPDKLSKDDVERFSRQIIIPAIGCKGQMALKTSSILIVGVGGLGCPAAQYLAGSGVGHIGLVDYDEVECSNLHRQLLHTEDSIGVPKVTSASIALKKLNSSLRISEYHTQLNSSNALNIVQKYDIVIDATDNVATRYLLNDACVLSGKPLVSGSALRLEGQLTVYNYNKGPCYRCIFPKPPPPETVTNCGDGGVLGAVPGVVGVLEALEAIKIVLGCSGILSGQLLLFSAESSAFRNVRLRTRNASCDVCGENPKISHLIDYEQFCGAKATDKDSSICLLREEQRINAPALFDSFVSKCEGLLIDVRSPEEFEMCAVPRSLNIPLKNIDEPDSVSQIITALQDKQAEQNPFPVYVVCRRGNDSQKAVLMLEKVLKDQNVAVRDLTGGLHAWARKVDSDFPIY